jgi:regulatory subunit for Cdc7p protein kinase
MSRKQPSQLLSPARQNISRSISKRPRSPDLERSTAKRTKAAPQTPVKDREDERERRKAEREAQKEEFRVKYTRHFPSWTFHFDIDHCGKEGVINDLKGKITQLGGVRLSLPLSLWACY